jgi:hypothetical protein
MRFVGNLTLNLHDCGGQEGFMKDYLSEQRHVRLQPLRGDGEDRAFVLTDLSVPRCCVAHAPSRDTIFSNVSVMIYIFDVASDNAEVRFIFTICHHPCLRDRPQHTADQVVSRAERPQVVPEVRGGAAADLPERDDLLPYSQDGSYCRGGTRQGNRMSSSGD